MPSQKEIKELQAEAEKMALVRQIIEQVVVGEITETRAVNRLRWFIWGKDPLSPKMLALVQKWLEDPQGSNSNPPAV